MRYYKFPLLLLCLVPHSAICNDLSLISPELNAYAGQTQGNGEFKTDIGSSAVDAAEATKTPLPPNSSRANSLDSGIGKPNNSHSGDLLKWESITNSSNLGNQHFTKWKPVKSNKIDTDHEKKEASPYVQKHPTMLNWESITIDSSLGDQHLIKWEPVKSNNIDTDQEKEKSPYVPRRPTARIQTLNRSVAFSDRTPAPDVAWKVPQGFRWSEDWFFDISVLGANTRPTGSELFAWNNGDATAELHTRLFQSKNWTFGMNFSVRSVYQGSDYVGGSTRIGEGSATGFRLDYAISDSSGIALGAEQLIQFDSVNDTGRNLYLVGSKGWWLGGENGDFPLAIATIGFGTGRFGDNEDYQFLCADSINASIDANKTYPLCWSPIASAALVFNENISLYSEYNSQDIVVGLSSSLNNSFPVRLSWGLIVGNKGVNYSYVGTDYLRWFFRASLGF